MSGGEDAQALQQASSAADAGLTNRTSATGENGEVAPCPFKCCVSILPPPPDQTVACPGLPFERSAVGTPDGGRFSWAIEGTEVEIVSENTETSTPTYRVMPKQKNGKVPKTSVRLTVTYTHGTCKDKKSVDVQVHGVDFVVDGLEQKDFKRTKLTVEYDSSSGRIEFKGSQELIGEYLLQVRPRITIKTDQCQADCAKTYRAGFIQDMTKGHRYSKYRGGVSEHDILRQPVRDSLKKDTDEQEDGSGAMEAVPAPFQSLPKWFAGTYSTVSPQFFDTPGHSNFSHNEYPEYDHRIDELGMDLSFTTWLVVQSDTWRRAKSVEGSLIYLKHFTWSITYSAQLRDGVALARESGSPVLGPVQDGKGDVSPTLSAQIANSPTPWNHSLEGLPQPPPARKHKR